MNGQVHSMSQGNPEFRKILDQMWEMHCRKADDYGSDEDSLANVRGSVEYGIPSWMGAMLRANDKVHRIKRYAKKGKLSNEGVEDSFLDLAAYAVLALVLFREERASLLEDVTDVTIKQ